MIPVKTKENKYLVSTLRGYKIFDTKHQSDLFISSRKKMFKGVLSDLMFYSSKLYSIYSDSVKKSTKYKIRKMSELFTQFNESLTYISANRLSSVYSEKHLYIMLDSLYKISYLLKLKRYMESLQKMNIAFYYNYNYIEILKTPVVSFSKPDYVKLKIAL